MPVKSVPTLGWTRRSAAVTVLLAMSDHRKEVGARIAQLRQAKRWSQEDLAHASRLSTKTISRLERGTHEGRRSTVDKVARALKVKTAVLIGEPPQPLGLGAETQLDRLAKDVANLHIKLNILLAALPDEAVNPLAEEVAQVVEATEPIDGKPLRKPAPEAQPKRRPTRAA